MVAEKCYKSSKIYLLGVIVGQHNVIVCRNLTLEFVLAKCTWRYFYPYHLM